MFYSLTYKTYLLQYYLRSLPLSAPSKEEMNGPANLESTNFSPFIPRTVFITALINYYSGKKEAQNVLAFINQNVHLLYASIVEMEETSRNNYLKKIESEAESCLMNDHDDDDGDEDSDVQLTKTFKTIPPTSPISVPRDSLNNIKGGSSNNVNNDNDKTVEMISSSAESTTSREYSTDYIHYHDIEFE